MKKLLKALFLCFSLAAGMFLFSCSSSVSDDDTKATELSETDSGRFAYHEYGSEIGGHGCGNKSSLSR